MLATHTRWGIYVAWMSHNLRYMQYLCICCCCCDCESYLYLHPHMWATSQIVHVWVTWERCPGIYFISTQRSVQADEKMEQREKELEEWEMEKQQKRELGARRQTTIFIKKKNSYGNNHCKATLYTPLVHLWRCLAGDNPATCAPTSRRGQLATRSSRCCWVTERL